ncbi:MAG: dimethyl sulfoxide reductase anchor subunit, partial [Rhodobacterales bacterium]|nr:dimethyl sulfoxide reductase anchor subunit [Rhodobacterales bacterium]
MHPAFSVIFFTVFSGAGYGLLALMALGGLTGWLPRDPAFGAFGIAIGVAAVTAGLLSSTFHLGHPERAWRALTQWRSSWLSREGVAALLAYGPITLLAYCWVFQPDAASFGLWAGLTVLGAVVTVYCTAMIYASLQTIQQWSNPWTIAAYLVLGLAGGLLWLAALAPTLGVAPRGLGVAAIAGLALGWIVKRAYWAHIDGAAPRATTETATGLGAHGPGKGGTVRPFEAPHTADNYLLKEMGYQVARKHAGKLRRQAQVLGFALPALLLA